MFSSIGDCRRYDWWYQTLPQFPHYTPTVSKRNGQSRNIFCSLRINVWCCNLRKFFVCTYTTLPSWNDTIWQQPVSDTMGSERRIRQLFPPFFSLACFFEWPWKLVPIAACWTSSWNSVDWQIGWWEIEKAGLGGMIPSTLFNRCSTWVAGSTSLSITWSEHQTHLLV